MKCKLDEVMDKKEVEALIEDIFKFKRARASNLSIIDIIIEYAYFNERDVQELGNIISEHKEFVEILEKQLIREKFIKQELNETTLDESEW